MWQKGLIGLGIVLIVVAVITVSLSPRQDQDSTSEEGQTQDNQSIEIKEESIQQKKDFKEFEKTSPNDEPIEHLKKEVSEKYFTIATYELFQEYSQSRGDKKWELQKALLLQKNEALPIISNILRQGSEGDKIAAIELVASLRWKETSSQLNKLVANLNESEIVRGSASYALGELGIKENAPYLATHLKNTDSVRMQRSLLLALAKLKNPITAEIIGSFQKNPDDYVKLYTEVALARMGELRDKPVVAIKLSNSDNWKIQSEAIVALGEIGGNDALRRLEDIAATHPLPGVRLNAGQAIEKAKLVGLTKSQALEYIRSKIEEPSSREILVWAMKVAGEELGDEGLNLLKEKSKEPSEIGDLASFYYVVYRESNR